MSHTPLSFDAAIARHDALVANLGLAIWVGSEPTFTDRSQHSREWLSTALGGDKEVRAQALVEALAVPSAGSIVLRSIGRRYPGEENPRWSYGIYRRRDGVSLWDGPKDPLLTGAHGETASSADLEAFAGHLVKSFAIQGWHGEPQITADGAVEIAVAAGPSAQPAGTYRLDLESGRNASVVSLALPEIASVADALAALHWIETAARAAGLRTLIIAGEQPPIDHTVELTTVTPDPAVIEINTAPSRDAKEFLDRSRTIYAAAAAESLSPYRLYFNGAVACSGGGGQITLGGPSPDQSPFLREPRLLPRLVRFMNRHPSLSYLFSHDFSGSNGQSARADERGADAFDELALALALLDKKERCTPAIVWQSLAPFLCDATGNSHRAEINVEKLYNPLHPGRGQQGLVEFRALRMQHTPERATALACLLRSIVAMLATRCYDEPLIDWGRELHDRFAMPYYLEADFADVLAELRAAGLPLDECIADVLWREEFRFFAEIPMEICTLEIRRALEFWPLLGDATSPEQGGTSRMIDASTARLEFRLRPRPSLEGDAAGADMFNRLVVTAGGIDMPFREERDARGPAKVYALRYRNFAPHIGLHPLLASQAPVELRLSTQDRSDEFVLTIHEWRPDREAYNGLPRDLKDAAVRRAERVTVHLEPKAARVAPARKPHDARMVGPYCLDLRYLS